MIKYKETVSYQKHRSKDKVFEDFPNGVIIDGDDDWYAPKLEHPEKIAESTNIKILGLFHSGHSGITTSGIIIDKKDINKFISIFNKLKKDDKWILRYKHGYRSESPISPRKIKIIKPTGVSELEFTSPGFFKED